MLDPWARFRHRPATGATRADDEDRSLAETSKGWITAAWWVHGVFYAAVLLFALGNGDPEQWRWIVGPLATVTGVFTVVRPQAAFEVDNPRYWFRRGHREPSRAALRWNRVFGVLLIGVGLFALVVAPLLGRRVTRSPTRARSRTRASGQARSATGSGVAPPSRCPALAGVAADRRLNLPSRTGRCERDGTDVAVPSSVRTASGWRRRVWRRAPPLPAEG